MAKRRVITGRELPETYKEKFDVSSEDPSRKVSRGPSLETSNLSLYFSGSCIPTNESL